MSALAEPFSKHFHDSSPSEISPSLPTLEPLTFPSFFELAEKVEEPPVSRRAGLFESLLGDPRHLYAAILDEPERYEREAQDLLILLILGRKKLDELDEAERALLDAATFEFAQANPAKPKSLGPLPTVAPPDDLLDEVAAGDEDEEPEIEWVPRDRPAPTATDPLTELEPGAPTFWWKRQ